MKTGHLQIEGDDEVRKAGLPLPSPLTMNPFMERGHTYLEGGKGGGVCL